MPSSRRAATAASSRMHRLSTCGVWGKKSTGRRLDALTIEKTGAELIFPLTGDGFLHHMVRILVGTLLEIGAGARPVSSIAEIFASGCRANAGVTVPAQGLCLMEVQYH